MSSKVAVRLGVLLALLVLACVALAGCSSAPKAPQSHVFDRVPAVKTLNMPLPLPPKPKAEVCTVRGVEKMCFDQGNAVLLEAREETLLGNMTIAVEAVNAHTDLRDSYITLHQQARIMEAQQNAAAQRLAEAEAALERERRDAAIERWLGRGLLILLAGAAL
jgi:hypothetical protein